MFIVRDLLLPLSLLTAFAAGNLAVTVLLRRYGRAEPASATPEPAAPSVAGDRHAGQTAPALAC